MNIASEEGTIRNPNYQLLASGKLDIDPAGQLLLAGAVANPGNLLGELASEVTMVDPTSLIKNVGKGVEKYSKRALRSNYNPLSIPIKNIGTKIARISDNQYRDYNQILDALKGKSQNRYFGQHLNQDDFSNIKYGINDRDLNKTYFKGDKTNLKELKYDTSKDLGLKSSEDWYGNLNAYELNSEIPNNEKLDIIDFLKSMNTYQWNEADNFKTGQYVLSEGIENLMKDYPGENLLNLGKLTGNKRIGLETFNDEQLKVVKDNLRHLFEKHGSDKIPFEVGKAKPSTEGIQLFGSPVKPIDDIAGHMGFLERNPVTGDINYTTRDVWGFNPKAYSEKYGITRKGEKIKPFEKLQVHLMDSFGKPFILHQTNPLKFKDGGYTNPYMYYAGGPMQYKRGGLLKDIGLGVADFALGTIGGVTGIKSMKDIVNEKQYSNDRFDAGANFAGSIGSTALKVIPVTAPIANAAGVVGGAANKAFGIDAANYNPNQEVSDLEKAGNIVGQAGNVASMFMGSTSGVSEDAGKFMQGVDKINQFGQSPAGQLLNQGLSFEQGGDINKFNNFTNSMRDRYNSYRNKYSRGGKVQDNAEEKLEYFGMTKVPNHSGFHYENPNGGSYGGENASFEKNEIVLHAKGGPTPGPGEFVFPSEVNGQKNRPAFLELDKNGIPKPLNMTIAQFVEREAVKGSPLRKNNNLGKERVDMANQQAMDMVAYYDQLDQQQAQQKQMMIGGALQYAAAGGKINKDIEKILNDDIQSYIEADNYYAYGGYLPKNKKFNMPYSNGGKLPKEVLRARVQAHMSIKEANSYVDQYANGGYVYKPMVQPMLAEGGPIYGDPASEYVYASGGPIVSNVPQPFNGPAAQNRGGMMMADGGMMPQNDSMSKQIAAALQQGADPQQLLQQLIKSGMDPQQAQAMLEAIMGSMQASQTQAPMMAMGGEMYAPGGFFDNLRSDFNHGRRMAFNKPYRNAYNLAKGYNTINPKNYPNVFTEGNGQVGGEDYAGLYPMTQDEATQYQGYDPTKVNQSANTNLPVGNEDIFGNDKLGKGLAIGQAAIPLIEAGYHLFNKPKHIKAPVVQAATVNYEPSRIIDQGQTNSTRSSYLNMLRNSGMSANQFAGNAKDYLSNSAAEQAGRNAISIQNEQNQNAVARAQAENLNAQNRFAADQLNYEIDQNRLGNIFGAFNNAATMGMQGYSDIKQNEYNRMRALSTQSENVTPVNVNGRIYQATKGPDGYYFNGKKIAEFGV
jgi:hypothetical protein